MPLPNNQFMLENKEKRIEGFYYYVENKTLTPILISGVTNYDKGNLSKILNRKLKPSKAFLDVFEESYQVDLLDFYNNSVKSVKNTLPFLHNQFDSAHFKSVPFYNINVSAGDVVFLDDGMLENREPDDLMFIPKNIDADIAFPTYGHSMYPEISNGDRVAYKIIKDWSFFNYGMKYLIITDEQRMVKYLKRHPKEGYVLLESRNKDFEPIDMPISSIRAILQVRYIGKIEM